MKASPSDTPGKELRAPLAILHLEDNPHDREFVYRTLIKAGIPCDVSYAETFEEFDAALARTRPHLILSDFTLPGYSGCDALAFAKARYPDIPYIFISGTIGEERAVESLKNGATDYVLKNNLSRLPGAVERATRAARESLLRREAEAALHESEQRFREMAENIRDVFWISTPDGTRLLYVSPGFANIWGRPVAELHAQPGLWVSSIIEEDRNRVLASFATLAQGGEVRIEYRVRRPDDSVRWVETRAYPSSNAVGAAHAVGVSTDITESKLLQQQLLQAQKLEAIGQLAGGIAHDFNNLLTVINGYSSMILADPRLDDVIRKPLQQIQSAGERAANLTRQLLVFSRKQPMIFKPIDLNRTIDDSVRMLRRLIGEQIALNVRVDPLLPPVEADAGMIEQLLMNLVVNARDAMPRGGSLLIATASRVIAAEEVKSRRGRHPGRFVRLSVTDTGEGIPPEIMPKIFDPFFTTKDVGKGTGLGLAMVFGIAETHHGWVQAESRVGEGTTFHVFLPVAGSDAPVESSGGALPEHSCRGMETILLVEDDPAVRNLTRTVLRNYGYDVLTASTGPEALEIWKRHGERIRLLLTDVVMPDGMSGLDLAKSLRTANPALKAICMSGYSREAMDRQLSNPGDIEFLQKPCSPPALARLVRDTLDKKVVWAE